MIQPTPPNQPQAIPRAVAIAGLIFSLLMLITLGIIRVAIPEGMAEQSMVNARFGRAITLALHLVPFAGLAFLWFIGVLRNRMGAAEDQFVATVFLPTAFIDGKRPGLRNKHHLSWEQVNQLLGTGIEFGSHTVNHPVLVNLDWREIEKELVDSKTAIESQLGSRVDLFGYPNAYPEANRSFSSRLQERLIDAGYNCCATTRIGRLAASDDPFTLKRLPVNDWFQL